MVGAGGKDGYYYGCLRNALAAGPTWRTALSPGGPCPLCGEGTLSTAAYDGTRLYVGAGRSLGNDGALGSVVALDPTNGQIIWRATFDSPVIAPVSYANGVVFAAGGTHVVALDALSGAPLWRFNTKAQCVGGVAITDRGIFVGDLSGTLYAFSVSSGGPPRKHVIGRR
jgi:outer membrane protein assembly factor BamB